MMSELVQLKLNIETSVTIVSSGEYRRSRTSQKELSAAKSESTPTEAETGGPLPLVEVGVSRLDQGIMIQEMIREEERLVRRMAQDVLAGQRLGNYPLYFNFPLHIQFDLTARCNLRCLHCFNDSPAENPQAESMTDDRWRTLAGQIIGEGGVFEACFSGGEPLLKKDLLLEMLGLFAEDGASLMVITNGNLLDEKTVVALQKFTRLKVRLSIDGHNAELHDGLRQVPGSFHKAVKAARLMALRGVAFEISSCVTPASLASMERMAELTHELGAGNILFDMLIQSGRAAKNKHLMLDLAQAEDFYTRLKTLRHKQAFVSPAYTGTIPIQSALSGLPQTSLLIRPNGDVRLGCLAPFVIGSVLTEEIGEIWRRKGIGAWEDPRVREYLRNTDVVSGANKGLVNYLDQDVRLDFSSLTKKEEGQQDLPPKYTPPSVIPYPGFGGYENNKQDLSLLSLSAKGTALKAREDGYYLLARSAREILVLNWTARLVYRQLDGTRTIGEIAQELAAGLETEAETVKADLTGFCRKLTDFGLIKLLPTKVTCAPAFSRN